MTKISYPIFLLAAIGFALVLVIHVAALLGGTYLFECLLKFVGPGLFVVWLPTVLVATRLTRDFKQKDFWRAALRGCPEWMRKAQWCVFIYAWAGFFILPLVYGGGMDLPANKARSMSGILLALYSIAASVMYSAAHVIRSDEERCCPNGHRVSPSAKYCEECGAPIGTANA